MEVPSLAELPYGMIVEINRIRRDPQQMMSCRKNRAIVCSIAPVLALIGAAFIVAVSQASGSGAAASAAKKKACTPSLTKPSRLPAYANTPWPTEHADAWRTHAVPTGLPADVRHVRLVTASAKLPAEPVWGYIGTGAKLYVIGGSPYLLNMFTELMLGASTDRIPLLTARTLVASRQVTPYVGQIDPKTMKARVLPLTDGSLINYTGGLLVHSNGYLYAVVRGVLYKINPATFQIETKTSLPPALTEQHEPNPLTTYNGIAAASNGDLILKGWASAGGGENAPGTLLRVNPDDLSFIPNTVSGISSARMALVDAGGSEYIYLPGPTQSVRFVISGSMFTLDPSWSSTYLGTGDTPASSDVYMGHGVVFANNTNPQATTATRVFAKGADPAAPLQSYQAFKHKNEVGWNFFMMAGDPYRSGIAAVGDQATGRVAGYQVCGGGTAAQKLWENDNIRSSAGMAINYNAGHLYTDDRQCPRRRRCRLFLVVLDLHTGDELARVRVRGTKPSMGQIFIGRRSVYYVATQTGTRHGFITRVTASHR
jgi:hypothetical protein